MPNLSHLQYTRPRTLIFNTNIVLAGLSQRLLLGQNQIENQISFFLSYYFNDMKLSMLSTLKYLKYQ